MNVNVFLYGDKMGYNKLLYCFEWDFSIYKTTAIVATCVCSCVSCVLSYTTLNASSFYVSFGL